MWNSSIFQQYSLFHCVWSVVHVSPPMLMQWKWKDIFLYACPLCPIRTGNSIKRQFWLLMNVQRAKSSCCCVWFLLLQVHVVTERMEGITNCKTDRKLAKMTVLTAALIASGIIQAKKKKSLFHLIGKDLLLFYVIYDGKWRVLTVWTTWWPYFSLWETLLTIFSNILTFYGRICQENILHYSIKTMQFHIILDHWLQSRYINTNQKMY